MALDTAKLENVVSKPNGMFTARCPACAEDGADTKGEHLAVFPDGKFGCVVNPKEKHTPSASMPSPKTDKTTGRSV